MQRIDIESIIESEIQRNTFPGIVLVVEKNGSIVASITDGYRQVYPTEETMTPDTLFDLASLTKPLATALMALILASRNELELAGRIGDVLPELDRATGEITFEQLLLHTGGLRPESDIYRVFTNPDRIDRDKAIQLLLTETPATAPGREVVYSCTGYLLLGVALERISGVRLKQLFRDIVAEPCGLSDLLFVPEVECLSRIAPTESCSWRKRCIRGEVHDENAYCLGGDAGNAGLFGTATSILSLLRMFDTDGVVNGFDLLPRSHCDLMHTCLTDRLDSMRSRRAIGYKMQDADAIMGPEFSSASFGQTGFTGTSVWIDPEARLKIVALTNRVHFGRESTAKPMQLFRRRIHSAISKNWR